MTEDQTLPSPENNTGTQEVSAGVRTVSYGARGAIVGGLAGSLFVLITRPLAALILGLLGLTTPSGEITNVDGVSVRWKTMADFPFPQVEILFGAIGALAGAGAGISHGKRKTRFDNVVRSTAHTPSTDDPAGIVAAAIHEDKVIRQLAHKTLAKNRTTAEAALDPLRAASSDPALSEEKRAYARVIVRRIERLLAK